MAKRDYFRINSRHVEEFLEGVRKNDKICTTHNIAKNLRQKYGIKLHIVEVVNEKQHLYMYQITI